MPRRAAGTRKCLKTGENPPRPMRTTGQARCRTPELHSHCTTRVDGADPMRMDKLTTKFQQALADAQSMALGLDNGFIEPQHVLLALIDQDDGSTKSLL